MFGWFRRMMPGTFFDQLKRDLDVVENKCIYNLPTTIWLMVFQRLSEKGTLQEAVAHLRNGSGRELLDDCKRTRESRISSATGAFGQARRHLQDEAARRVAERSFEFLFAGTPSTSVGDRAFVIDGSTIRLAHSESLAEQYPPARKEQRQSHWPNVRIAVMHHIATGIAMAPAFGPAHGSKAVSEQKLARDLIDRLPPRSVLIGDRNFGVFEIAWRAHRHGHHVLMRLSAQRAKKLAGGALPQPGTDLQVVWQPSTHERSKHPEIEPDARIAGRLVAVKPERAEEVIYLFTTLEEIPEKLASIYCQRWTIETDLRSLKGQVRLHQINARSPQMVACELYLAVATWNLIRAVMQHAATQANIDVRRVSFSATRTMLMAMASSTWNDERTWQLAIEGILQNKLPRRNRPSKPREVWPNPQTYPRRKVSPNA